MSDILSSSSLSNTDANDFNIINLIDKKNKKERELANILSKYLYKYIKHIFNKIDDEQSSKSLYPDFQKRLLSISMWSSNTIDKEYLKFLKWCNKKYNVKQNEMEDLFKQYINLTIQIITKTPLNSYDIPSDLKNLYYKSLKKIARLYYENPKSIKEECDINDLKTIILNKMTSFIPMKDILDILETVENQKDSNVSYNFNENSKSEKSGISITGKEKLIIKKDNTNNSISTNRKSNSLRYISSDEFQNEYYNSDDDKQNNNIDKKQEPDLENIKHIKIPKMKKLQLQYNTKIDEVKENFFTDN